MTKTKVGRARRAVLAVGLMLVLAAVAACGKLATQPPPEQGERLEKAAGVAQFRIECSERLWENTIDSQRSNPRENLEDIERESLDGGLVAVTLSGPQLVEYLARLDHDAHPGSWDGDPDPMAVRMYDALAPVVDSIMVGQEPDTVPVVTINDAVAVTPEPTPPANQD